MAMHTLIIINNYLKYMGKVFVIIFLFEFFYQCFVFNFIF